MTTQNWSRVRYEANARRYGTEASVPRSQHGQPGGMPAPGKRRPKSTMTAEQRRRWADAVRHVYGKGR